MTSNQPDPLPTGTLIGAYAVTEVLGRGYFSISYRAQDELRNPFILVEHCPSDQVRRDGAELVPHSHAADFAAGLDRFVRTSEELLPLQHRSLCALKDLLRVNGTAYQVWDDIAGRTLEAVCTDGPLLTQDEADALTFPVLEALAVLHSHGRLHLDLSRHTLGIRSDNGQALVYGLGQRADDWAGLTHRNDCLPPEQYLGDGSRLGPWSDIYAMAATLYRTCSGTQVEQAPSRQLADTLQPLQAVVQTTFRPGFLDAIDAALVLQPAKRPQSIAQWAQMLRL